MSETREAKRLRELAEGSRKLEPEDLALFGVGAVAGSLLPAPTDLLYFYVERWLDDHRYEISPTKYWGLRALNYYVTDSLWHIGTLGWVLFSKRPVTEKAEIYFSLLAAGSVVAVLFDFVRDEKKEREEKGLGPTEKSEKVVKSAPSSIQDWEMVL